MKQSVLWSKVMVALMLIVAPIVLSSCSKDDDEVAAKENPASDWGTIKNNAFVATGAAVNVYCTSCVVQCKLNPDRAGIYSDKGVELSTDGYNFSSSDTYSSSISPESTFTVKVTYLKPKTTYYYRSYVKVAGEYYLGETRTFTTPEPIPLTSGFVELYEDGYNRQVLWAACNEGCSLPEQVGNDWQWPSAGTTKESLKEIFGDSRYMRDEEWSRFGGSTEWDIITKRHLNTGQETPEDGDWADLRYNCNWYKMTYKGVPGYAVSNNENGRNTIFIPIGDYLTSTCYRYHINFSMVSRLHFLHVGFVALAKAESWGNSDVEEYVCVFRYETNDDGRSYSYADITPCKAKLRPFKKVKRN